MKTQRRLSLDDTTQTMRIERRDEIAPAEPSDLDSAFPGWWRVDTPVDRMLAKAKPTLKMRIGRWMIQVGYRWVHQAENAAYRGVFRKLWGVD